MMLTLAAATNFVLQLEVGYTVGWEGFGIYRNRETQNKISEFQNMKQVKQWDFRHCVLL